MHAFVPDPLPPANPPLALHGPATELHAGALAALSRLAVAGTMVPNTGWFLYGFVRKEAVLTSQIEGVQATLPDVVTYDATARTERFEDVQEVCNYVDSLAHARAQLAGPRGLPLSVRLLRDTHRILMSGIRGSDKLPGEVRRSQNWIGGRRPGNARFVPPPTGALRAAHACSGSMPDRRSKAAKRSARQRSCALLVYALGEAQQVGRSVVDHPRPQADFERRPLRSIPNRARRDRGSWLRLCASGRIPVIPIGTLGP